MYGYDVQAACDESTGEELTGAGREGRASSSRGRCRPGCMQTVWGDDERFVDTYWQTMPGRRSTSTFDWGIRDEDGYYFILGRTDDVINVAGHRLGTREIEESISSHPTVAEVAVVGVADALKGQVAMAFVVPRDAGAPGRRRAPGCSAGGRDDEAASTSSSARWRGRRACTSSTLLPKTRSRQAAAPRDPGRVRRPRPGRPDDDRGSGRAAADPRSRRLSDEQGHEEVEARQGSRQGGRGDADARQEELRGSARAAAARAEPHGALAAAHRQAAGGRLFEGRDTAGKGGAIDAIARDA